MEPLLTAQQTAEAENEIFQAHPEASREAMRRAGRALADFVQALKREPVLVVCGRGNNGGDGYACAAELARRGIRVFVSAPCGESTGEDAQFFAASCERLMAPCPQPGVVVDALLGIGFHAPLSPEASAAITEINFLGENAVVVAADIPSGLNASDGSAETAVRADHTITFSTPKLGHAIGDGPLYTGHLLTANIGLQILPPADAPHLLRESDLASLLPPRRDNLHKSAFGSVGVWGGEYGMEGAAMLCAISALKSGAGRVSILASEENEEFYLHRPWPLMLGTPADAAKFSCLVFGMGAGRNRRTAKTVRTLLKLHLPLVLDADALTSVSKPEALASQAPLVITPHAGEAALLLNTTVAAVRQNSIESARALAEHTGAVVVLKNDFTVIAAKSDVFVLARPNSALAKAGSGDVLAGCIAGLMASGASAVNAACAGVLLHSAAGRVCAQLYSARAATADQLPQAFQDVLLAVERPRRSD